MSKSKTPTKKTTTKASEQPIAPVATTKHRKPADTRRVAVQYTPRIPAARCPWC